MTSARVRRNRVIAVLGALLLVVGLTVVSVTRLRGPDCTVGEGDAQVELARNQAEAAARALAPAVRGSASTSTLVGTVARRAELTPSGASTVVDALTGRTRASLVCSYGGAGGEETDQLSSAGLTERASGVRTDIEQMFGQVSLGGFAPGGVSTGHIAGSAHYEGRAIDAFFRPINAANKTRGWALAQYLVAQAARLEVSTVIFDGRIWTARRADKGWRDYRVSRGNRSAASVRILEHRDHVHVDVAD